MKKAPASSVDIGVFPADHVRGPATARVILIGYEDYSSATCARAYPVVKAVEKAMAGRVRYVSRPFSPSHKDTLSERAAEAAECADSQGQFWAMRDRLFESGSASDDLHFARYARDLGLDVRQFEREMRSHVHRPAIRAARAAAKRRGVETAPTFFVNSTRHESDFGLATLLAAVQAAAGEP